MRFAYLNLKKNVYLNHIIISISCNHPTKYAQMCVCVLFPLPLIYPKKEKKTQQLPTSQPTTRKSSHTFPKKSSVSSSRTAQKEAFKRKSTKRIETPKPTGETTAPSLQQSPTGHRWPRTTPGRAWHRAHGPTACSSSLSSKPRTKISVGWVKRGHYITSWWLYHWLVG